MNMHSVININGVYVQICDDCYYGNHNTMLGHSHIVDDISRSDCKVVGLLNGKVVQCSCRGLIIKRRC